MSVTSPTSITASGKFKDGSKKPKSFMMVKAAIKALADPKGSSLAAIKKYISAHFMVDMVKKSHFICKAIRSAVNKGKLVQTKGMGASGTFKISVKTKSKVTKDVKTPKSAKKPDEKKLSKSKSPVKKPKSPKMSAEKKSTKSKSHVKKASKKKTVQSKTPKKTTTKTKTPKKSTTKKTIKEEPAKKTTKKTVSKKA
ncbi:uncharacterized protein [Lepeophtheirus salmonis]|uniref:uncharacterized protein n=1 Tax=Lepeophtheirus salmonis TaxID=72036 RepID=UPI001AE1EB55|nr:histone H1-like [Lepeophtheirus salmonis]